MAVTKVISYAAILSLLMALCLPATGCGGKGAHRAALSPETAPAIDTSQWRADAPSPAEMQAELARVLAELGIDASKITTKAPSGTGNAVFDLDATVIDPDGAGGNPPTGIELSWTERLLGDYNQDGLVNVSDLIPLGFRWQDSVTYDDPALHGGYAYWPVGAPEDDGGSTPPAPGSGADNWRLARIDGNGNGLVEIQDIIQMGQHWQEHMDGYIIERAVNFGAGELVWDAAPLDIGYGGEPSVPRSLAVSGVGEGAEASWPVRYSVLVSLTDAEYSQVFRVRAYDGETQQSNSESNLAYYYPTSTGDTTPPVWVETVGVTSLIPGNESLTAHFGTAVDSQSPPVSYRVYWAEGDPEQPDAPFDYAAASHVDVDSAPYTITGLTNDQYYRIAVRAMDNAAPANMELNTVALGETVRAIDLYPPEWQGGTGIQDVFYGSNMALLFWDPAVDHHEDEHGTWESGPVVYRVYHGQGRTPDWANAQIKEFPEITVDAYVVPLYDIDTTEAHWYSVRARDSAQFRNEDTNAEYISVPGVTQNYVPFPPRSAEIPNDVYQGHFDAVRWSPNLQYTCFFLNWRSSTTDDYWIERIRVTDPPSAQRDVSHFESAVRGVYEFYVDNAGEMSFISTTSNVYPQGETLGYYRESDNELIHVGPVGGKEAIGYTLAGEPFVIATKLELSGPLEIVSAEQYFLNMITGSRLTFNYVDEGTGQEISDATYTIYTAFAVLSNGCIKFAPALRGQDANQPNRILIIQGDQFTISNGPLPLSDGSVYRASYGYGVQEPIDLYVDFEPQSAESIHFSNTSKDYSYSSPHGFQPSFIFVAAVLSIDKTAAACNYYAEQLYDNPDEDDDFSTLIIRSGNEVVKFLPIGRDSSLFRTMGYDANQDIVIGIREGASPELAGYQRIHIVNDIH